MTTPADYQRLEARVAELEHQLRNVLPYRVDAIAYAVSLVHADVTASREVLDQHTAALASVERRLDRQAEVLTDHGHLLAEILRRLPADPAR
jgi:hypothetical protein